MIDKEGEPFMVGMDQTLDTYDRRERIFVLVKSALGEVIEQLPTARSRVPLLVFLGLPQLGPHHDQRDVDNLCHRLVAAFASRMELRLLPVPEGNAAGLMAMQRALQAIEGGLTDRAIVAGVDSWIDPDVLEGLDASGRVTSLGNRWGFPPGEGAGALLVCPPRVGQSLGLPNLGWVAAVELANEPASMHSGEICIGRGLGRVLGAAASKAGASITKQFCDIDGERYREHEMANAILRLPSTAFVDAVDYVAPIGSWGNVGAAYAPLLTILPIVAHARGFSPGAWPMVWCGSESGLRAAMVLHLPPRAPR